MHKRKKEKKIIKIKLKYTCVNLVNIDYTFGQRYVSVRISVCMPINDFPFLFKSKITLRSLGATHLRSGGRESGPAFQYF